MSKIDTEKLLYIDQPILNENKTRRKNLSMAWIDYKKAYNMVSQSWILYCRKMYKIPDQIVQFIEKTTETWRVDLTVKGKSLAEVDILRGIFYHNYYLWEPWCHPTTSLGNAESDKNTVNRKKISTTRCTWTTSNILPKNEKEIETLILYIDLRHSQTCHFKGDRSAYSIGVGELGWQYGTGLKSHGTVTD